MKQLSWQYYFLTIVLSFSLIISYASPSLRHQFDHAKSDTARLAACIKLIQFYKASLKNDSCLLYINQGLELVNKAKNTTYHGEFYTVCGRFFSKQQPELSLTYLNKGRYWAIKNNQIKRIATIDYEFAKIYSDKAISSRNKSDFTTSLRKTYGNIQFAQKHKLQLLEGYNYGLLANFYKVNCSDSLAYAFLRKALSILVKEKAIDKHSPSMVSANLEYNFFFKNFAEAASNLRELDKMRQDAIGYDYTIHVGIISCCINLRNFAKAIEIGTEVQSKSDIMASMPALDKATFFTYLSEAYLHGHNYKEAKRNYLQGVAFADEFERKSKERIPSNVRIDLLKNGKVLFEKEGNFQKALAAANELATLKDSINANQRIFELAAGQERFEAQTKEDSLTQQIQLQKLENQYKGESLEQSKKIQWLSVLIIISLVFIILFVVVQTRKIKGQSIELKKLNDMQNKLFGIISHDLRSPVVSLQTFLGSINRTKNPERAVETFSNLEVQVGVVSNTLDNLLNWSINQMGGIKPRIQKVNILEAVEHILELSSHVIHYKSISVNVSVEEDYVLADGNLTEIVIRNILTNAIKFTPVHGAISLSSRIEKDELILQIQDNGIGMTEAQLNTLFLNYNSRKGTMGEKGSGLGLKLSHELMAAQQGKIDIQSKVNVGTIVTLSFNASQVESIKEKMV
ncbi:hypothetical protein GCM10028806_14200 [Spirosoma terrae]|uniref:histidine kinase n=1 Tax=Spirosoma terrae TaxID=1968276 RepID=A0A6L9L6W3_9BACT|nr:HAMP domain-containing sensor histidine kinase [Spirosoma terrae]NDU95072.1 HAMP domain-containing histidine kinase [Spirosoma terrae]